MKFKALLLGALFCANAVAGIRIINNGGGTAEMHALTVLNEFKRALEVCVASQYLCSIENQQEAYRIINNLNFNPSLAELEFFSDSSEPYRFSEVNGFQLGISTSLLYTGNTQKPYSEIARAVVQGWLSRPRTGLNPTLFTLELAQNISTLDHSTLELSDGTKVVAYTVPNKPFSRAHVVLKSAGVTRDITSTFSNHLKCTGRQSTLISITELSYENGFALGVVKWICGDSKKSARFALGFEPALRIVLTREVSEPLCTHFLGEPR